MVSSTVLLTQLLRTRSKVILCIMHTHYTAQSIIHIHYLDDKWIEYEKTLQTLQTLTRFNLTKHRWTVRQSADKHHNLPHNFTNVAYTMPHNINNICHKIAFSISDIDCYIIVTHHELVAFVVFLLFPNSPARSAWSISSITERKSGDLELRGELRI